MAHRTVDFISIIMRSCLSVLPGPMGDTVIAPETLRSQLETDSGCPQTITRRNLDTVQVCDAPPSHGSAQTSEAVIHVLLGIRE